MPTERRRLGNASRPSGHYECSLVEVCAFSGECTDDVRNDQHLTTKARSNICLLNNIGK